MKTLYARVKELSAQAYMTKELKKWTEGKIAPLIKKYGVNVKLTVVKFTPDDFEGRSPPVTWSGPGVQVDAERPSEMTLPKWHSFRKELFNAVTGGPTELSYLANDVYRKHDNLICIKKMAAEKR